MQRVGVEPTDANLRLAHFLGANGAANYLNNGQISPQAARANGGMEKVQQLAQQKLAGVQAPTSGASLIQQPAQQPVQQQPQPIVEQPTPVQLGINAYQAIQNDPNSLIKLGFNENQPEFIRNRAKERALELYSQDKQLKQAETDLKGMNPNQLATVMQGRDKSSVGDWMQYLLFKHVGLTDLANEKGDQLGIGHKWQGATDGAGNNGLIRYGASGKPLEGVKSDNTPMTSEELAQYASMGTGKWQTNAEYFQDKNGNIYQSQHNDKGQTRIVDTKTSQPYKGAESLQRLRDVSGLDKLNQQQVYRRENFKTQLNNALSKETFANRLGVFKQYNSALVGEGLPPLSMEEMGLTPTGQFNTEIKQPSAGAPTGAPAPAPTGAPAPAAGPRPTLSAIENKKEEEKAAIATQAAANRTRAETAAKTIDEKLNNLNTVQEQAQRGINALENNQHLFGGGSNAIARANNRLNPLKTQSEEYRNTADIMQLAQRENLTNLASLLKGSFSDKDLAYINKNMINENSSPAQVKTWLDHYVAASRRAYEQQASSVNQANAPSPGAPAAPQAQVRKYNPQTGRLE